MLNCTSNECGRMMSSFASISWSSCLTIVLQMTALSIWSQIYLLIFTNITWNHNCIFCDLIIYPRPRITNIMVVNYFKSLQLYYLLLCFFLRLFYGTVQQVMRLTHSFTFKVKNCIHTNFLEVCIHIMQCSGIIINILDVVLQHATICMIFLLPEKFSVML